MKSDVTGFLEFIGQNKKTFIIPVYQRNYDWKIENCKVLYEDIINLTQNTAERHFLGTIVYVIQASEANFSEFIVIDGQQRITTIMLVLKAIIDCSDDEIIKEEIFEDYLTNNKRSPEKFRLKLKTTQADDEVFQNLIYYNKEINRQSNIKRNYEYFKNRIGQSIKDGLTLRDIYEGIMKLTMVYIQLDKKEENPQLIFESLNSTGLDLSQADLIRNYLLMGHSYDIQNHLYNEYWNVIEKRLTSSIISDFVRDYITLKTCVISKKDFVYQEFKKYCQANYYENDNVEDLLKDLTRYAEWYSWFHNKNSPNKHINEKLNEISILKSKVAYPYLLDLFDKCYFEGKIEENELVDAMDIVITYLFRRLLADYPTNILNKVFNVLGRDINNKWNKDMTYAENLLIVLLNKKGKAVFPNDEFLKQYMLTKDTYNFSHSKFLFYKLESFNTKEIVEYDDLTIEHIMPQTLTAKWRIELGERNYEIIHQKYLHNIGNLTLTGYNSELYNKSFAEKKKILIKSNIETNRMLCEYENWTAEEIMNRNKEITEKILKVWSLPNIDKKYLVEKEVDISGEVDINEDINVTRKTPYQLIVMGEEFTISSWKEMLLKTCEFFYDFDNDVFKTLINHNDFVGRNRVIISDKEGETGKYEKIGEDLYIQINLSANAILNYVRLIVEKFDGFESEVFYKIR